LHGILSSVNGNADHIRQRIAMAVAGLSSIERQVGFKVERGWKTLPLYADVNGKFSQDYTALWMTGPTPPPSKSSRAATGPSGISGGQSWDSSGRPWQGPDHGAGPDGAVERPGPDASRPRDRLVPEYHLL